ncbi:MAG: bifunctional UDP-N-acetylglucosamine diphosphorylase/glucosamine-1-phosphate N-acetyltransferase GlmU, partial [Bdellovibrionales bacterium]|nr:bifunctional UDP-N-acetylglucosamine diphosphorylase/glucosamine-1-phosphate N-acetyltransferase GlmU [Bdellovibrionales bacterium]
MNFTIGAVILAAGEGKRLKLDAPKPLAPCLDKKLVDFPIRELEKFFSRNKLNGFKTAVIGHQRELVKTYISSRYSDVKYAIQERQLGTADALRAYFDSDSSTHKLDYTLVICADTPVVSEAELTNMLELLQSEKCDAVAATFNDPSPKGYGRIIRGRKGFHIVEEKDATDLQRKITEVNSGLYLLKTSYVLEHLKNVDSNNKSGEFYLTDIFKDDLNVKALLFPEGNVFLGVNNLEQLEMVEGILRAQKVKALRSEGVRFINSAHTYIDDEVEIGAGTVIYPNTHITGKTKIGKNVVVEMGAQIKDSVIADNAKVLANSVLEGAKMAEKSHVGPFARLRQGADIGPEAKIGNFVEIKKSVLDRGVKVSHLSYVGDAFIGENTNIGCGFITCNYDGVNKNITKIGKNCFIGSDSQTVAPVEIGDDCFVASSSTITKSMPEGAFAISRGQQVTKEGMAKRFIRVPNKK